MIKYWYLFLSYIAVFLMGSFSASQFVFDDPISINNWIITIFLAIFFIIRSNTQ